MKSLKKTLPLLTIGFLLLTACKLTIANEIKNSLKAVGSSKMPFTDSSVATHNNTTFPYNAIGKLWFTKSNGVPGVCTATIVSPGVVVTAGHCVHSGNNSNSGFSYHFRFSPGYYNGTHPYGIWQGTQKPFVAPDWYKSGGVLPNPADYALIVFKKNNLGQRIGEVANWISYRDYPIGGAHVTVVGYANNLDKGNVMHRVDTNVTGGVNNTGVFGSNMAAGADGSPVIINFGVASAGDPAGWVNRNLVASVVSYSGKTALQNQVGSQFDYRFITLMDSACHLYPWACFKDK
jgi:V8-like Glu-specific endopeptidase